MGKDQELLDAARNGNLAVVEKIVSQRSKRSGPLASLRRGPGANVQDNSGYTPLHHAALNGHRDVVSMLLQHEASTNIVDNKGSTPLHLAAWTGNTDIVRMILMQGLVPSNVNSANHDRETPLHSAAQYGHTEVVSLLLQHNADPIIRNNRDETPLDLAAQYGRLEAVELMCRTHAELLGENAAVRTHSPLHLASRNGHRHVVQVLLRYGMGVNVHTDGGSALHEAALFGKVDVVRVLLDHGVDLDAEDSRRRTVFDILDDLKTHISQEIATIIKNHQKLIGTEDYENANRSNAYHNIRRSRGHLEDTSPTYFCRGSSSPNGHCYQMVPKPRLVEDHRLSGGCLDPYQIPPPPRSLDSSQEGDSDMSMTSSSYQTPPPPRELDAYYNQQRISLSSEPDGNVLYQVPPPPRDGKRYSDPVDQKKGQWHQMGSNSYIPMAPLQNSGKGSLKAPQKPPRKNMSPHSPTKFQLAAPGGPYEFLCMATSGDCETGGCHYYNEDHSGAPGSEYVDMRMRHSYIPSYENHCPLYSNECQGCLAEGCDGSNSPRGSGSPYENVSMDSKGRVMYARKRNSDSGQDRPPKPNSLNIRRRQSPRKKECPMSPTGYDQPPTPDFPPPSPGTAESGIHEKIRPLSQEYKRRSRDIETYIEDDILQIVDERPFAGLYRGSTRYSTGSDTCDDTPTMASAASDSEGPSNTSTITNERPRRLKSPREGLSLGRSREGRSVSRERKAESLVIMSPFDENEEWAKIADIIASCGMPQGEWPMSKEIEEQLVARIESTIPIPQAPDPNMSAIGKWLDQIGVPEYEDLLLANGFDHLDFVGGSMLEEQELFEIGILNAEHRSRIVASACTLPEVVPIESKKIPESVDEWLDILYLGQYKDTFKRHNYCDMDRVRGIWEVELTTILEITLLGHKKRILASLGERPLPPNSYENISDLNTDLKHLKSKISQLNMVSPANCETGPNGTLKGGSKLNTRKGPAPQPPNGRMSAIDTNGNKEIDACLDSISIRSPSQLFTGIPSALTTEWRHKPEALVAQCCNYTAQYLGSTLVRELKGVETTRKSIQKLKKSTSEIVKVPKIILSISYKGVKFIDAKTKNIVCEHEIRNIHCACQDADDLNHFAYITKDLQSDNHYCHVFSVVTMDMATEVILTLGQAFEVAYQVALRDKGRDTIPSRGGLVENGVERGDKRGNKTLPSPDTRQQVVT